MPSYPLGSRQPSWFQPQRQDRIYHHGEREVFLVDKTFILKKTPVDPGRVNIEADTHQFVTDNADSIPVPRIHGQWLSPDRRTHYLLQDAMPGRTLLECWSRLSADARLTVATQVAECMRELAHYRGSRMTTLRGHPLRNNAFTPSLGPEYLPRCRDSRSEIWERVFRPELAREGLTATEPALVQRVRDAMPPCANQLVLTHGDLYAGNVLVDPRTGRLTGIIDWESAGFWPEWFQYARIGYGCGPDTTVWKDREWKWTLSRVMQGRVRHGEHGRVWLDIVSNLASLPRDERRREKVMDTVKVWLRLIEVYLDGQVTLRRLADYKDLVAGL